MNEWYELFVATTGAAAALAGLIIVAMSVNIETIIKAPTLPSRAGATIASLVLAMVVSVAGLIPRQSDLLLGLEVLLFSLMALAIAIDSSVRVIRFSGYGGLAGRILRAVFMIAQVLPFLVGGVILCLDGDGGVYWVAAGIIAVLIGAVMNAWVLLVEILR